MAFAVTDLNLPADKLAQFAAALGDASNASAALQGICDGAAADVAGMTAGYVIDPARLTNWSRCVALYRAYAQAQFGEIPKAVADEYKTAWDELTAIAEGKRPNLPKIPDPTGALATRAGAVGSRFHLPGRMRIGDHLYAILAFLIFNFSLLIAQATPVYFSLQQLTGLPKVDRFNLVVDAAENPYTDGTNIYGGALIQITPIGGQVTTNLVPAGYTLSVPGWTRTLHFVVPQDTNVWNVINLITNGGLNTLTNWAIPTGSLALGLPIGSSNGAAAQWMLGMDAAGNLTSNAVPIGGGGGGGGGGSSGTATNLTGAATNQVNAQALAQAQSVASTNVPAYATTAGTATNLTGGATNQVNAQALAQAQAVASTNVPAYATTAGSTTNLTGGATNQVNAQALAQAQAVASTNVPAYATTASTATNLIGGVTNRGTAILTSMIASNAVNGPLDLNGPSSSTTTAQLTTYQGSLRTSVPSGSSIYTWMPGGYLVQPTQYPYWDYNGSGDTEIYANALFESGVTARKNYQVFYGWGDERDQPGAGFTFVPTTDYGLHGGSGAGLEGLPVSPNELAPAMPTPPFIITTWCEVGGIANSNETLTTNMLARAAACGLIAAVTNAGGQVWFHHDENARLLNAHRDGNGFLSLNTTAFPDGSNYAAVVHSYGAKLMGTIYYWYFPTNEIDVYSQGIGVGYPYLPALTPNSVHQDISKFYDFGWDALRLADDNNAATGGQLSGARLVAESILNPFSLSGSAGEYPYGSLNGNANKTKTNALAVEWLTPQMGSTASGLFNACNLAGHDFVTWPGDLNSSIPAVEAMCQFRGMMIYEIPFRGPGHYGMPAQPFFNADTTVAQTRLGLTMNAMALCYNQVGFNGTNVSLVAARPNFVANVTNAAYLSVFCDRLCNKPFQLFDAGSTNISGWARQVVNGYAVALVNETALNSNITFTLASLGADPTKAWALLDVWSNVMYTPVTGSFTYSNVPAQSASLLLLTPTNYYAGNGPIVVAGANVTVTPTTNAATGQITYSVASTGGGGSATNATGLAVAGAAAAGGSNVWVSLAGYTNIAQVNFMLPAYTNISFTGCSNLQPGFSFSIWVTQASTVTTNQVTFNTNYWQPQIFGQILTMPINAVGSGELISCFAIATNVVKFTQTLFL